MASLSPVEDNLPPCNVGRLPRRRRWPLIRTGLACLLPPAPGLAATKSSAPEQIRATDVDGRADIFSFGALLYELLSGRRPFFGETAANVITAILHADQAELPAGVPGNVREIVHRCLEKNREQRFQSARDLAFA